MGNECRCIMCKKQLIGGETVICPRCFYMGHRIVRYVDRHRWETAAVAVAATQGPRIIKVFKVALELAKL